MGHQRRLRFLHLLPADHQKTEMFPEISISWQKSDVFRLRENPIESKGLDALILKAFRITALSTLW